MTAICRVHASSAIRSCSLSVTDASMIGKRVSLPITPSIASAAFTPAGLGALNRSLMTGLSASKRQQRRPFSPIRPARGSV
jgi:hypothetical protein